MDRIAEASLTEVEFAPPDDFDALRHLEQSIALLPRNFAYEVLLKTDLITARQMLAALPFPFVIHEPVELRQALRDHAAALNRLADL
jgi:hypothetical protein